MLRKFKNSNDWNILELSVKYDELLDRKEKIGNCTNQAKADKLLTFFESSRNSKYEFYNVKRIELCDNEQGIEDRGRKGFIAACCVFANDDDDVDACENMATNNHFGSGLSLRTLTNSQTNTSNCVVEPSVSKRLLPNFDPAVVVCEQFLQLPTSIEPNFATYLYKFVEFLVENYF